MNVQSQVRPIFGSSFLFPLICPLNFQLRRIGPQLRRESVQLGIFVIAHDPHRCNTGFVEVFDSRGSSLHQNRHFFAMQQAFIQECANDMELCQFTDEQPHRFITRNQFLVICRNYLRNPHCCRVRPLLMQASSRFRRWSSFLRCSSFL